MSGSKEQTAIPVTNQSDADPREDDIIIPVMGETKAGKSTFINRLLREAVEKATVDEMKTSAGLKACTKEVMPAIVLTTPDKAINDALGGRRLVFVDTPGFNDADPNMSDQKVLSLVSDWLAQSYRKDMIVGGVIYLHDITQEGWTRSCQTNLDLFFKLCGEEAMTQVLIVATKWDKMSNRIGEGTTRLGQLKDEFWKPMIDRDASVCTLEHTDTPGSILSGATPPWDMVRNLVVSMNGRTIVLQIQREIVTLEKELGETEAGKELLKKLEALLADAKKTRKELKKNPADPAALLRTQERIEVLSQDFHKLAPGTKRTFFKWVRGKWQLGIAAVGFK